MFSNRYGKLQGHFYNDFELQLKHINLVYTFSCLPSLLPGTFS